MDGRTFFSRRIRPYLTKRSVGLGIVALLKIALEIEGVLSLFRILKEHINYLSPVMDWGYRVLTDGLWGSIILVFATGFAVYFGMRNANKIAQQYNPSPRPTGFVGEIHYLSRQGSIAPKFDSLVKTPPGSLRAL